MTRFTPTLATLGLLTLALLPVGPAASLDPATAYGADANGWVNVTTPSGSIIFHVSNPNGLGAPIIWFNYTWDDDYRPLQTVFVRPNGTVQPLHTDATSGSQDTWGDGYAYVGNEDTTIQAPAFHNREINSPRPRRADFDATEGWVVMSWDRLKDYYSMEAQWPPGTTLELVSVGTVESYEMPDFRDGHRAGAAIGNYAFLRYHKDDSFSFDAQGGQVFGFVGLGKSDTWAKGSFDLTTAEFARSYSFDTPPVLTRVDDHCICYDVRSWMFTTSSDVEGHLDFIGDGRLSLVNLLLARHEAGILPPLSAEFDHHMPGY